LSRCASRGARFPQAPDAKGNIAFDGLDGGIQLSLLVA
jgi:hypothetical protein